MKNDERPTVIKSERYLYAQYENAFIYNYENNKSGSVFLLLPYYTIVHVKMIIDLHIYVKSF